MVAKTNLNADTRVTIGNSTQVWGWDAIAEYFPYSTNTVMKKYGKEMLDAGFVFKSVCVDRTGQRKWRVWTYEHLLISFISYKQAKEGRV